MSADRQDRRRRLTPRQAMIPRRNNGRGTFGQRDPVDLDFCQSELHLRVAAGPLSPPAPDAGQPFEDRMGRGGVGDPYDMEKIIVFFFPFSKAAD